MRRFYIATVFFLLASLTFTACDTQFPVATGPDDEIGSLAAGKNPATPYTLVYLEADRSFAHSVNNQGQIAGWAFSGNGMRAALWHKGERTQLDEAPSRAYGINRRGQVVGYARLWNEAIQRPEYRAVMWDQGERILLDEINPSETYYRLTSVAYDINDRGQAVGYVKVIEYPPYRVTWRAVMWEGGREILLESDPSVRDAGAAAVNNKGQVVGYAVIDGVQCAVMWEAGRRIVLAENAYTQDINDREQVVGNVTINGESRAVLWQDGEQLMLAPDPDGNYTGVQASGLNASGQITGGDYLYDGSDWFNRPMTWLRGTPIVLGPSGDAGDISDSGLIVGASEGRAAMWIRK